MVALREGKQSRDIADRGSAAVQSKSDRKRDRKRAREADPAEKENVKPEQNISKDGSPQLDGGAGVENSTSGSKNDQHTSSKIVKKEGGGAEKRRKTDDQVPVEDNATNTPRTEDQPNQNPDTADDRQDTKQLPKERTRKALEIEWDRSQLRDPRTTPERVLLPRKSERDLTERRRNSFWDHRRSVQTRRDD